MSRPNLLAKVRSISSSGVFKAVDDDDKVSMGGLLSSGGPSNHQNAVYAFSLILTETVYCNHYIIYIIPTCTEMD